MTNNSRFNRLATVVSVGALALGITACATDGEGVDAQPEETAAPTFVIPQQTGVPPWAFTDDADELIGMLPDLSVALGPHLGVEIENERNSWENALLGLENETYVFVPGAGITDERLLVFDFAVALRDGYGFKVRAGDPEIADDMGALCGLSIGLPAGASVIPALEEQSAACVSSGDDELEISTFPDWASADLAAQSGQIDVATATISSMRYQSTESPGVWTITGPEYAFQEIGFAVPKGSEWGPRLVDAFNEMIADGRYAEIFEAYDTTSMMVEESLLVTE